MFHELKAFVDEIRREVVDHLFVINLLHQLISRPEKSLRKFIIQCQILYKQSKLLQ